MKKDNKRDVRGTILRVLESIRDILLWILQIIKDLCLKIAEVSGKLFYKIPENMRYPAILAGLVCFVIVGTIFCVHADNVREKAAREEALRVEAMMKEEAERKAEEERKKAEEERRKSDSLQAGVSVGRFEQGEEKIVYMTFDDGPSENTRKVLDILAQYDAKATFFVIGDKEECRPYIKEAYEAGHTIGLHSYSHDYAGIYSSTDAYFEDLEQIGNMVKEQIGFVPCYVRFPGGSSNTVSAKYTSGIMTTLSEQVPEMGYQYYDWNWDSGDGGTPTSEQVYQNSIGCEENEVMLLFHDAATKQCTVDALPAIIEHYKERGYEFRGISRDSFVSHHSVNN